MKFIKYNSLFFRPEISCFDNDLLIIFYDINMIINFIIIYFEIFYNLKPSPNKIEVDNPWNPDECNFCIISNVFI